MSFRLVVKEIGTHNYELFNLYLKNYDKNIIYSLYKYLCVMESFAWFTLVNEHDEIIGECSISNRHNVYNNDSLIKTFEFHDVFVEKEFRGNNYSELMILNVLYYLDQNYSYYNYVIKTDGDNLPAIKTYTKICGKPIFKNKQAIFSYPQSFNSVNSIM